MDQFEQIVMPGEIARAHRHSAAALRLIIEGRGGYTVVNGKRVPMFPGDLVLTPNWSWHDLRRDYSLLGRRERMTGATIASWRPVLPFRYASLYGLRSSGTGYSWSGYLATNRKKETSTGLELP